MSSDISAIVIADGHHLAHHRIVINDNDAARFCDLSARAVPSQIEIRHATHVFYDQIRRVTSGVECRS
jgi:hypothetical protein